MSVIELHTLKVQAVISKGLCASSILMWKGDWEICIKPKECTKPFWLWVNFDLNAEAPGNMVSEIIPRMKTSLILRFSHFNSLRYCNVFLAFLRVSMYLLSQKILFCKWNCGKCPVCQRLASPHSVVQCSSPSSCDEYSICWKTGVWCYNIAYETNNFLESFL